MYKYKGNIRTDCVGYNNVWGECSCGSDSVISSC